MKNYKKKNFHSPFPWWYYIHNIFERVDSVRYLSSSQIKIYFFISIFVFSKKFFVNKHFQLKLKIFNSNLKFSNSTYSPNEL